MGRQQQVVLHRAMHQQRTEEGAAAVKPEPRVQGLRGRGQRGCVRRVKRDLQEGRATVGRRDDWTHLLREAGQLQAQAVVVLPQRLQGVTHCGDLPATGLLQADGLVEVVGGIPFS